MERLFSYILFRDIFCIYLLIGNSNAFKSGTINHKCLQGVVNINIPSKLSANGAANFLLVQRFTLRQQSSSQLLMIAISNLDTGLRFSIVKVPILARVLGWIIRSVIESKSLLATGLSVSVSSSNMDIFRGRIRGIMVKFDKIDYGVLQISGGGKLLLERIELRYQAVIFPDMNVLKKDYTISAEFVLTQSDIVNSKIIRELIQLLADTLLKGNFNSIVKVTVKKVIIASLRIFIYGDALTPYPDISVPFELSTGIGTRTQLNRPVVFLKNLELIVNRLSVPLFLGAPIDIDLGENCIIESLVITNRTISARAKFTISPVTPFTVVALPEPTPKVAMFRYDLAEKLSSLLRVRWSVSSLMGPLPRWIGRLSLKEEQARRS